MEASTSNGSDQVKTYRGRSLEELLPQIRAELGPDAIVLRRREGLSGGVGGLFQRPYVEIEARAPLADEKPLEIRSDRATVEGLSSPAVQALFEQATPFADALAAAAGAARTESPETDTFAASDAFREFAATVEPMSAPEPVSSGLYGPQPNADAIAKATPTPAPEPAAPAPEPEPEPVAPAPEPVAEEEPDDEIDAPHPPLDPDLAPTVRPPGADAAEKRLVAAGLSPALSATVVGEAVAHGLPFANPRTFKKLVRTALARRIPVLAELGAGARTIAFVGAGGTGKTSAVAHLAAAYHAAGAELAVISLRGDGDLGDRLEPLGISVIAADDAMQAKKRLGRRRPLVTLIDTPAAGPSYPAAQIKALAADLKALGATEVHLALPATLSSPAAGEVAAALAPLAPTHVALTHADETARPGAPLELAIMARKPVSYVCAREDLEPADPGALAQQLLP
jgi:flagellar biosynthesis GTPase FlhF